MVSNYSLAGDIAMDVVMRNPAVLNGQGEVIMSSSQWSAGHVYMDVKLTRYRAKRLQSPVKPPVR